MLRDVRIAVIETGVCMVLADHIEAEAVSECLLTGVARHHVNMPGFAVNLLVAVDVELLHAAAALVPIGTLDYITLHRRHITALFDLRQGVVHLDVAASIPVVYLVATVVAPLASSWGNRREWKCLC